MESMAKMRTVKLAGREFPLAFTLQTIISLQETIDKDFDAGDIRKAVSSMNGMVSVLYQMASDGAKLSGTTLDVDREWFALHIPVNQRKIIGVQLAVIHTAVDWMEMESEEDEDEGREIDLVLREIQKKRQKTD